MAIYDDVERRTCGHCGCERDARSMSYIAGRWICMACYNAGKRVASQCPDDQIRAAMGVPSRLLGRDQV
jgi:phenylacetate-coenzyme A ligase PaaK-like adenylate-forming protein